MRRGRVFGGVFNGIVMIIVVVFCLWGYGAFDKKTVTYDTQTEMSTHHFEYKNHKYISFKKKNNFYSFDFGIVHDPDCECNTNKNK